MIVWQAVTADEYELPIAQADSLKELTALVNKTTYLSMRKQSSEGRLGKSVGFRVYKIEIDDELD